MARSTSYSPPDEPGDPLLHDPSSTSISDLPSRDALPAEVQKFLTDLLISTRGLPEPKAREIAEKWKLGTGEELWSYPTHMFRHLFGVEEGWAVYKEVKLLTMRVWLAEQKANPPDDTVLRRLVVGATIVTLVLLGVTWSARNEAVWGMSLGFAIGCGIFSVAGGAILIAPPEVLSAERTVENRLKNDYFKPPATGEASSK